ncbi:metallophosphoesterase family protein [Aliiroseovarius sp. Z3]|uniref:metallophosphoesterase family protein n=1 Tax=Aliiroseovarius sp. Z3 TaxID=2811402 RepID=UPI0023B275D2|nr:metallophosphoesterase family protein [Aliiroseovarius sp. Z3]
MVGDIHGRMDLLAGALEGIANHWPEQPVVFVGDYIDRGPNSAEVLRHLFGLQSSNPDRIICLLGNHEDMLLGFLDGTLQDHRIWFQNGGDATLRSFGISLPTKAPTTDEVGEIRDSLQQAMGADLMAWLRDLPLVWRAGNVWVTHAGADPFVDMERQDRTALLWGHPDFRKLTRTDDQWVVHGHTIVPEVLCNDGRIAIDTGAYHTGRLSVVHVSDGGIKLLP